VVLGGGIAGLSAAGVLARHFEEVTLVERDAYPEEPGVRSHATQGAHVHILLAKGLEVLSRYVPELGCWFDELGLREGDLTEHVRLAYAGRWLPRKRSGIAIRPCTRPVVEHLLRRDVMRRRNITVLSEHKAKGIVGQRRVSGVRLTSGDTERVLEADLVVDAMGRASPSARWLDALGTAPLKEDSLDAGVVYASCLFEPPASIDDDWVMVAATGHVPSDPNTTAVTRLGPGKMLGSFIVYGWPKPPRSAEGLVARTAELTVPHIHRLLRASRPISDVAVFANTGNRWRRYGQLPWFPDGLVCLGDTVCSLNPRYAQGMTVAALSSECLDTELSNYFRVHRRLDGFSQRFQKSLEDVLRAPWQMALAEDRLWVSIASGKAPGLGQQLVMKGMSRFLEAVNSDVDVWIQFMRVAHMLDAPTKILSPKMLAAFVRGPATGAARSEEPHVGTMT